MKRIICVVMILISASGCALLSKSEPFAPRYFSAEEATSVAAKPRTVAARSGPALKLGTISSGSDIRQNLVFRASDVELGFYEDRRWTEKPEVYLRRSLSRALFEDRGLQRVISGRAVTLEVELAAFEEWIGPPNRVRASVVIILHDERTVLLERTLTVEHDVIDTAAADETHPDAVVRALSAALTAIVEQIAGAVTGELRADAPDGSVAERTPK